MKLSLSALLQEALKVFAVVRGDDNAKKLAPLRGALSATKQSS